MNTLTPFESRLKTLLSDYGHRLDGTRLICNGVRGYTSDRVLRRGVRGYFDACEMLIPLLRDDEFTRRFRAAGEDRPAKKSGKKK